MSPKTLQIISATLFSTLYFPCGSQGALADLTDTISSSESILFSDDFNDNSNNWSDIGTSTGEATIGQDPGGTGQTVYYPSNAGDGSETLSSINLGVSSPDLSNGTINAYMRVRVDANAANDRFYIGLSESGSAYFNNLLIIPSSTSQVIYRKDDGSQTVDNGNTPSINYPDTSTYLNFKISLTATDSDTTTITAFQYDGSTYVSILDAPITNGGYDTGIFDTLTIQSRNAEIGDTNSRSFFDALAVTQTPIPEPSAYALIISLGAITPILLRRRR
ncbi:MAG: hypothetical protein ACQKBT_02285 [Puniceicoccales bacterium]